MAPSRAKPSALAERLAAVERELERLQAEKRHVERAGRRSARSFPGPAASSPARNAPAVPARSQTAQGELFDAAPPAAREEELNPGADHRLAPHKDRRFASYFSAGGIQGVHHLHQERRIQRNKAIAMLICAVILLLWVISLVF